MVTNMVEPICHILNFHMGLHSHLLVTQLLCLIPPKCL